MAHITTRVKTLGEEVIKEWGRAENLSEIEHKIALRHIFASKV